MQVTRFYVQFAAANGKTKFVGNPDKHGVDQYPTQRDAAQLFVSACEAQRAADCVWDKQLAKGAVPMIRERRVTIAIPEENDIMRQLRASKQYSMVRRAGRPMRPLPDTQAAGIANYVNLYTSQPV